MPASNLSSYHVRPLSRAQLDVAIDWAAREGWNPGLHDATCFHAADPDGFLGGFLDDELVATISVVKYGSAFAFLGLYIVAPAFRGRGYGMALWDAAIARLGPRTVGLDGVVAQQAGYRKSGFAPAYRNVRYRATGGGARTAVDDRIVPLGDMEFDAVNAYDRAVFAADRSAFLAQWIRQPGAAALGFVHDGELAGYGVLRPCRAGFKIGPLFADGEAAAETLFDALAGAVAKDADVYLDVPEPNRAAVALAARHGMSMVFETARMYAGAPPAVPLQRVFGVTTFELG